MRGVTPTPARSHPENGGMAPHQFFENNFFSEANQLRVLTVHEGHMGHYHHWRTDDSSSSCFQAIVNVGKMRGVTPTDAIWFFGGFLPIVKPMKLCYTTFLIFFCCVPRNYTKECFLISWQRKISSVPSFSAPKVATVNKQWLIGADKSFAIRFIYNACVKIIRSNNIT